MEIRLLHHSALMFRRLMMGRHFSISAFLLHAKRLRSLITTQKRAAVLGKYQGPHGDYGYEIGIIATCSNGIGQQHHSAAMGYSVNNLIPTPLSTFGAILS